MPTKTVARPFLKVARDETQTLQRFALDDLAQFTRERSFDPRDSNDFRVLYVGRDDVHGALKYVLARCSISLKFNQFGYDDDELDAIIGHLVADAHVSVQGTLDKSQSGGVHEKKILAAWTDQMRASFAIGQSATHQISHTKGGVLDNIVAWEGSTNWSASGEGTIPTDGTSQKAQNNTCTFYVNPVEMTKFAAELDDEHAVALKQMGGLTAKTIQGSAAA